MSKSGVLLLNLGTPAGCDVKSVRAYLKQFLMDPFVITLPYLARWLLVNLSIVPFRAKKSAAAYSQIWQPNGSPLLINSLAIRDKLAQDLGEQYTVALGMRYGQPDIASAVQQLQAAKVQRVVVMPLFPQYSAAATESALDQARNYIAKYLGNVTVTEQQDFFADPGYIQALAHSIKPYLTADHEYLLMSYHGLPEQQMVHDSAAKCDMQIPCPAINTNNAKCYRAQCYQTSRLLAQQLNLAATQWGIGFQSRLGRLPWIKPYTDELLVKLRQQGVKALVVCCPSFVADCLETLEEIGIRAREQWLSLGGTELRLVPCLNSDDAWIKVLAQRI